MSKLVTFLRTEPALTAAFVQALLALLIGVGLNLTQHETGAIEAAVAAAVGLAVAVAVHKFSVAALTGFLAAIGTLLIAFGVPHVSSGLVSLVNGLVVAAFALVLRMNVTPKVSLARAVMSVPGSPGTSNPLGLPNREPGASLSTEHKERLAGL